MSGTPALLFADTIMSLAPVSISRRLQWCKNEFPLNKSADLSCPILLDLPPAKITPVNVFKLHSPSLLLLRVNYCCSASLLPLLVVHDLAYCLARCVSVSFSKALLRVENTLIFRQPAVALRRFDLSSV